MKRKNFVFLFCMFLTCLLFPMTADADTGPKPSVVITFENMGDELCYGTLLSEDDTTGPATAWDGTPENISDYGLERNIWEAFVNYKDTDGYYFLQEGWLCSTEKKLAWTYYPPERFKILLYYPESGAFVVSGIYERYAFDSYFKVNMDGIDIESVEKNAPVLTAERSYYFTWELFSLFCRIIITILLELGVAFLFGFGRKNLLIWIGGINIVTQVLLNLTLNFTFHHRGSLSFTASYALLEPLVFIIEAALYLVLFQKTSCLKIPQWKIILYAFIANAASFGGGLLIAELMPIIF